MAFDEERRIVFVWTQCAFCGGWYAYMKGIPRHDCPLGCGARDHTERMEETIVRLRNLVERLQRQLKLLRPEGKKR